MRYIAIDNDNRPWILCVCAADWDVRGFLANCRGHATGAGFTTREATAAERARISAAHAAHIARGGSAHQLFALPV